MAAGFIGWKYRVPVVINNTNGGPGTNSVIQINLATLTGFVFANCLSSGNDIRVSQSDGTTLDNFDLIGWNQGSQTGVIWVQVPTLAGNATTQTLYVVYGNTQAPAASSFANTFTTQVAPTGSVITPNDGSLPVIGGVVGIYHCNDGTGSTLTDSSGAGNNLTLHGTVAWGGTAGGNQNGANGSFPTGSYLILDGSTTYATAATSMSYAAQNITFSGWVYPTSFAANAIVFEQDYQTSYGQGVIIYFNSGAPGKLLFGSQSNGTILSATTLTANVWTHIQVTVGSSGMLLWVNGVRDTNSTNAASPVLAGGAALKRGFFIGASPNGGGSPVQFFPGRMWDLKVEYNSGTTESALAAFQMRPPVPLTMRPKLPRYSANPVCKATAPWEGGGIAITGISGTGTRLALTGNTYQVVNGSKIIIAGSAQSADNGNQTVTAVVTNVSIAYTGSATGAGGAAATYSQGGGDVCEPDVTWVANYNGTGSPLAVMFYHGDNYENARIGLQTSPDGNTWTKSASNPIIGQGVGGESGQAQGPSLLCNLQGQPAQVTIAGTAYYVLFYGNGYSGQIKYVLSTDPTFTTWTTGGTALNASAFTGNAACTYLINPTAYLQADGSILLYVVLFKPSGNSGGFPSALAVSTAGAPLTFAADNTTNMISTAYPAASVYASIDGLAPPGLLPGAAYQCFMSYVYLGVNSVLGFATSPTGKNDWTFSASENVVGDAVFQVQTEFNQPVANPSKPVLNPITGNVEVYADSEDITNYSPYNVSSIIKFVAAGGWAYLLTDSTGITNAGQGQQSANQLIGTPVNQTGTTSVPSGSTYTVGADIVIQSTVNKTMTLEITAPAGVQVWFQLMAKPVAVGDTPIEVADGSSIDSEGFLAGTNAYPIPGNATNSFSVVVPGPMYAYELAFKTDSGSTQSISWGVTI